ncbi:MAG TPA: class II aldolase/adducin family protein [Alphaproteobacteria bacterium]|jgi:ribulose-5-phosphate 4-epimerase/fuculose-1-phosphate aldolase
MDTLDKVSVGADLHAMLEDLAKCCRILEIFGHGDRIYGHVAMRDPEGRGMWVKRHRISLGEVTNAVDFLLVDFNGKVLAGEGARCLEWPIHAEVMKARPDILFTGHTHPFHCVVYSSVDTPYKPVKGRNFGVPRRYEGSSDLVTTPARGQEIAETLDDGFVLLMRNHGLVFTGRNLVEFLNCAIGIEEACKEMLLAASLNVESRPPEKAEQTEKVGKASHFGNAVWDYYCRVLARAEAAGDMRLAPLPRSL